MDKRKNNKIMSNLNSKGVIYANRYITRHTKKLVWVERISRRLIDISSTVHNSVTRFQKQKKRKKAANSDQLLKERKRYNIKNMHYERCLYIETNIKKVKGSAGRNGL